MDFMENKEDLKIKELVALRGHYFSAVLLISSGIAGLFFAEIEAWKMVSLGFGGLFFGFIFLSKFIDTDNKIKTIIGKG